MANATNATRKTLAVGQALEAMFCAKGRTCFLDDCLFCLGFANLYPQNPEMSSNPEIKEEIKEEIDKILVSNDLLPVEVWVRFTRNARKMGDGCSEGWKGINFLRIVGDIYTES